MKTSDSRLTGHQLESFMRNFFGYGNLMGSWWFIGMEEAGGKSFDDIELRLNSWVTLGQKSHADLYEYLRLIGRSFRFDGLKPPLSRTWAGLIRVLLASQGKDFSRENIRQYQKEKWGRAMSDTCLMELLPLPSPSISEWHYPKYTPLAYLRSREAYEGHLLPWRIQKLKDFIRQYQPRNVLFYGKSYRRHWEEIAGGNFERTGERELGIRRTHGQTFVMMNHPVAHGLDQEYFCTVGNLFDCNVLRKKLHEK